MLFDTHAHLDQPDFDGDRDQVIARAREAGVGQVLAVGVSAEASEKCAALAAQYEGVYAAVGIQPNSVADAQPGNWDQVVALVERPHVIALGETGLDRYWDFTPFELQQDYFDRHIRLSQQRNVPLVVHMRDCDAEIMAMLREARQRGPLTGVMHSFTGDAAMAAECIDLGLYISFAGMVTFKKSDELRSVAITIPDDRVLIETDSPYLSPHPVRKQRRNEPANVRYTAACLAEARGVPLEQFAKQTTKNAEQLLLSRVA